MNKDLKDVLREISEKYPDIYSSLDSDKEKRIAASFYNIYKFSSKEFNKDVFNAAIKISREIEPKNLNDFYSILFRCAKQKSGMTKVAYPQLPLISSDDYDGQFDLDKWSNLVYKIYDAALSKDMSLENAIDYYSSSLNKEKGEDIKFKKWITYYLSEENKKYSMRNDIMKKKSDYQFGVSPSNFYYPATKPMSILEDETPVKRKLENNIEEASKTESIKQWREKLDNAIRRIDKLLRNAENLLGAEASTELAKSLHDFDMNVRKIKHQITASDLTYNTADKFKKLGFKQGYDILIKTAQEVSQPIDEVAPELPQQQQASPSEQGSVDPIERIYENTSGAKEGEYEKLSQPIELTDAIGKLEEIAARLSDRRVIRLLAEFDIMLDKIGIASMFPELAESQSKLIDSYSYSLVRVTKMLGMLSSGKNLSELAEARKQNLTESARKDVDKALDVTEPEQEQRGSQAIKQEFTAPKETQEQQPQQPATQQAPAQPAAGNIK